MVARDGAVKILGPAGNTRQAARVFEQLLELSRRGNVIQEQNVDYALALSMEGQEEAVVEIDKDLICHAMNGKLIKPKTLGQKKYVDMIRDHMIVFGTGPAAPARPISPWPWRSPPSKTMRVNRIILTRPGHRGGREAGLSARRSPEQGRPLPAAPLRRPL